MNREASRDGRRSIAKTGRAEGGRGDATPDAGRGRAVGDTQRAGADRVPHGSDDPHRQKYRDERRAFINRGTHDGRMIHMIIDRPRR